MNIYFKSFLPDRIPSEEIGKTEVVPALWQTQPRAQCQHRQQVHRPEQHRQVEPPERLQAGEILHAT